MKRRKIFQVHLQVQVRNSQGGASACPPPPLPPSWTGEFIRDWGGRGRMCVCGGLLSSAADRWASNTLATCVCVCVSKCACVCV